MSRPRKVNPEKFAAVIRASDERLDALDTQLIALVQRESALRAARGAVGPGEVTERFAALRNRDTAGMDAIDVPEGQS